jgi:hypothetical protein
MFMNMNLHNLADLNESLLTSYNLTLELLVILNAAILMVSK